MFSFFRRKETLDTPLVIFGLIALFIVFSIGFVVFLFSRRPSSEILTRPDVRDAVEHVIPLTVTTPEQVREAYGTDIDAMLQRIDRMDDASLMVEQAIGTMVAIRVPKEILDMHLQGVIALQTLQGNVASFSLSDTKKEVHRIVDPLRKAL